MSRRVSASFALIYLATVLSSCGTYTPDKNPLASDAPDPDNHQRSREGSYEIGIVNHVTCEIGLGLAEARTLGLPWITAWGTTVTQSITVEDQAGLSPGLSTVTPLQNKLFTFPTGGNVVGAQSFSLNFGASASANSLRTETIQYTFKNSDILNNYSPDCGKKIAGIMIDGDLKIREFIYDKAQVAASCNASLLGNGPKACEGPPFNTFTEEITFVGAYGGSFTPTWKLARMTAGASSNLLVGERTNTNDLVITLGPLKNPKQKNPPLLLADTAMNQHQARVQAAAIAVSIAGQTH
jgi:hypothetical protein